MIKNHINARNLENIILIPLGINFITLALIYVFIYNAYYIINPYYIITNIIYGLLYVIYDYYIIYIYIYINASMRYLHIWGCPAHVLKRKSDKLEAKTEVCMFLGYSKETKGYLFYNHKDNKVFVSTHAKILGDDYMNNFNPRNKVVLLK